MYASVSNVEPHALASPKGGVTGHTTASPGALAFVEKQNSEAALLLVVELCTAPRSDRSGGRSCTNGATLRRSVGTAPAAPLKDEARLEAGRERGAMLLAGGRRGVRAPRIAPSCSRCSC
jgi:hypothetical protein